MGICVLLYLAAINIVSFIVYGIDKLKAKNGKWRVSEVTMLLLAIVGGSIRSLVWCKSMASQNHA